MLTLILAVDTFSQDTSILAMKKEYYLQKAKNQKTAAWVLLGGGAVLIVTGVIIYNNAYNSDPLGTTLALNESGNTGAVLAFFGGLSCLGSIPFFIASGNNNRRAAEIAFGTQQIYLPVNGSVALKYTPALGIKIGLGKCAK